jgi:hypothetical protein
VWKTGKGFLDAKLSFLAQVVFCKKKTVDKTLLPNTIKYLSDPDLDFYKADKFDKFDKWIFVNWIVIFLAASFLAALRYSFCGWSSGHVDNTSHSTV